MTMTTATGKKLIHVREQMPFLELTMRLHHFEIYVICVCMCIVMSSTQIGCCFCFSSSCLPNILHCQLLIPYSVFSNVLLSTINVLNRERCTFLIIDHCLLIIAHNTETIIMSDKTVVFPVWYFYIRLLLIPENYYSEIAICTIIAYDELNIYTSATN